jgi:transcription initiation factor TFIIA large subunit
VGGNTEKQFSKTDTIIFLCPQGSVKKEGDDKSEAKGEDEDAINSDLDSSDDELDEELAGGGDNGGDIVIALYEKV